MKNVLHLNINIPYNIRSQRELYCRKPKTVKYGAETISHLARKIWPLVPDSIKKSSLDPCKWEFDCPCCLCKTYLQHVGFI